MKQADFANIIRLARRAPLTNMDEAEQAAALLQRFAQFANDYLNPPKPLNPADDRAVIEGEYLNPGDADNAESRDEFYDDTRRH